MYSLKLSMVPPSVSSVCLQISIHKRRGDLEGEAPSLRQLLEERQRGEIPVGSAIHRVLGMGEELEK